MIFNVFLCYNTFTRCQKLKRCDFRSEKNYFGKIHTAKFDRNICMKQEINETSFKFEVENKNNPNINILL